jgi:hypothetical protein
MPTTFKYAVSFESLTLPPVTLRGEVLASSTQAGARLAVKKAMSEAKGRRWSSLVVLLERADESAALQAVA